MTHLMILLPSLGTTITITLFSSDELGTSAKLEEWCCNILFDKQVLLMMDAVRWLTQG